MRLFQHVFSRSRRIAQAEFEDLSDTAERVAEVLASVARPVERAGLMAHLAGIEEQSAVLHRIGFGEGRARDGDLPLPVALLHSATLLRMVAYTVDAPDAADYMSEAVLAELVPNSPQELREHAWPYVAKLAAEPDRQGRADVLNAWYEELLPLVGTTAAETVAWLAELEHPQSMRAA